MKKRYLIPSVALGGILLFGGGAYFSDAINNTYNSIAGVEKTERTAPGDDSSFEAGNISVDLKQIKEELVLIKTRLYLESDKKELQQSHVDFGNVAYAMSKDYWVDVINDDIMYLERNLDEETRNQAGYLRCVGLLPNLDGKELAGLNSEIWNAYSHNEIKTDADREQFVKESIDFLVDSLDDKGKAELQRRLFDLDGGEAYQNFLKTKPLEFWLTELKETYGVKFSR